jgi:hypothetical protein
MRTGIARITPLLIACVTLVSCGGSNGDAPAAPLDVSVTAGEMPGTATVSFTAPASSGSSAITGYKVTANPGGITATGTSSPITVTGLAPQTSHTFSVVANNGAGSSAAATTAALAFYAVVETFHEPMTQPNDTIFRGTFTFDATSKTVSNLTGLLTQAMTKVNGSYGSPMTTVSLAHQLSAAPVTLDGADGLLVTTFALETPDTFDPSGFAPGGTQYCGLSAGAPNPKSGGAGNAYAMIFVNTGARHIGIICATVAEHFAMLLSLLRRSVRQCSRQTSPALAQSAAASTSALFFWPLAAPLPVSFACASLGQVAAAAMAEALASTNSRRSMRFLRQVFSAESNLDTRRAAVLHVDNGLPSEVSLPAGKTAGRARSVPCVGRTGIRSARRTGACGDLALGHAVVDGGGIHAERRGEPPPALATVVGDEAGALRRAAQDVLRLPGPPHRAAGAREQPRPAVAGRIAESFLAPPRTSRFRPGSSASTPFTDDSVRDVRLVASMLACLSGGAFEASVRPRLGLVRRAHVP